MVSVIMSAYNAEKYLVETIESILCQSYKDFEFIIVNDGSIDNTQSIIENYAKNDNRIVVVNQENIGLTKTLNKAIKMSNSKYIARIDADDVALSNRLMEQVRYLETNLDIDLVTSNYFLIDSFGKDILYRRLPNIMIIKRALKMHNFIAHSTVMFRREKFDNVGGYNERYKYSQDWDLWQRINKIGIIDKPLLKWRIHESNINFKKNNKSKKYNEYFLKNIITMLLEQNEKNKVIFYIKQLDFSLTKVLYYILYIMPNYITGLYFWHIRFLLKKEINKRIVEINNL